MKNKIIQIISAFLLAGMVVPVIVEGVELARTLPDRENTPFTERVKYQERMNADEARLRAQAPSRAPMRYTVTPPPAAF